MTDQELLRLGRAVAEITADWVVVAEIYRRADMPGTRGQADGQASLFAAEETA